MSNLPEHLGGHAGITHLDHGALEWAIETLEVKSMLDVGCGPGGMVQLAHSMGLDTLGLDGDNTVERFDHEHFVIHDFSKGPVDLQREFDLCWSVEFVEHVHAEFIPNFVSAFKHCKTLIITYAPPGWPGHHHVNCQEESYWVAELAKYGLRHDPELSETLRRVSTMNITRQSRQQFVKNRGMVFINEARQ